MHLNTEVKIVIADHYAIVRKGIANLLEDKGLAVYLQAVDGQDLIDKIELESVAPDICILELSMPRLNGYDTMKIMNKRWPSIRTIVFTGITNEYSIIKMLSIGARGYVLKNDEMDELSVAIDNVLETGYHYSKWEYDQSAKQIDHAGYLQKYFFSESEICFLKLCCTELTYKEMAYEMKTSTHNIDSFRSELFSKLGIVSRTGLVMFAIKAGLVEIYS